MKHAIERFVYDYSGVTRWALDDGFNTVTIEPTGWVVFSRFDQQPSRFVGVIWHQALFDDVVDTAAPPGVTKLWRAAAEKLCAMRTPGTTPHMTVQLADFGDARVLAYPYEWLLDGNALSAPDIPGPDGAGLIDERPGLTPLGRPFVIAMPVGMHRLEGALRLFEQTLAPRAVRFSVDFEVRPDAVASLELSPSPADPSTLLVSSVHR